MQPTTVLILVADHTTYIQAQSVIVPSLVSNTNFGGVLGSCYVQEKLIAYVCKKLLTTALAHTTGVPLASRIFISRKDAPQRHIINEDAVFALLQPYGFVRYELSKLCVTDQILLFHNAEIIISAQGTGLANSIFCKKNSLVIELMQGLNDCTFWYLSQMLSFAYVPIKTTNFIHDYVHAWQSDTYMPLLIIQEVIERFLP
jgi:capsular polysaccharide biosynthesis protein